MKIYILLFLFFINVFQVIAQDASVTGISRAFNPAISVNMLFAGMRSNKEKSLWEETGIKRGFHFQEICLELTSNVDVFFQSKVALSCEEDGKFGVEEAYVSTLQLPIPIIFKIGKMLNSFGKYNTYHLHHMHFADQPLILYQVFGEKLSEMSVEASYLLPLAWFSDLTLGVLEGSNENLFNSSKQDDFGYLMHLDNVVDITDEVTLRLGGSVLAGKRGSDLIDENIIPVTIPTSKIISRTWGANLHLKWTPLEYGTYSSFILQGEYLNSALLFDDKTASRPLHGFFVQAMRQFNKRWWLQARYGWFTRPKDLYGYYSEPVDLNYNNHNDFTGKRLSFALSFVTTEFSAYRLQYNIIDFNGLRENQIIFQINMTIGSHPAHKY